MSMMAVKRSLDPCAMTVVARLPRKMTQTKSNEPNRLVLFHPLFRGKQAVIKRQESIERTFFLVSTI